MKRLPLYLALLMAAGSTYAVEQSEQWTEEYDLGSQPRLSIHNVWGNIDIIAHAGDRVVVDVTETRRARSERDLERSRDNLYLEVEQSDAELSLEVTSPRGHWHCKGCELDIDYEIRVPEATIVDVSTVNDGEIRISGVSGLIDAHHVNGRITVDDAAQCGRLDSVNGDVSISFAGQPVADCHIHTVNGDMTVRLPANPDVDLTFDLHNGKVRSDFEVEPRAVPATVERDPDGSGTRYRLSKSMGVRIGDGGALLDFESINGDVRIEQRD